MFREGELAKLPKWAQDKVLALQGELAAQREALAALGNKSSRNRVEIDRRLPEFGFPDSSRVIFGSDGFGTNIEVIRDAAHEKDGNTCIIVQGDTSISVAPEAQNRIRIVIHR